jgi:sugar phosphate permease
MVECGFSSRDMVRRGHLLFLVFVTYSLAYLDRANFGFGAAAGMAATLNITEERGALLVGLFFLGYFLFQIPCSTLVRRFSSTRVVFVSLVVWGAFAALTGVIRQFWLLAIDRLLLGIAESAIFPAMLVLLTHWFTRAERSRANTFLILGNPVTVLWMSALTGYLIDRLGWQRTFIIEGLPSILWAIVWIALVRDHPSHARWMEPARAAELEAQIEKERLELGIDSTSVSLRAVLLRKDILLLALQYFLWSLGVYGFVLWLPTMVRRGGGLSMTQTGLMSAVPYVAAIVLMPIASYVADRTMRRREVVWPFLITAGFALLGSFAFAERSFPVAFMCLVIGGGCMYAPYGAFFAMIPERVPKQVIGEVMAMVNSFGALGSFVGSYSVGLLQAMTGSSRAGFLLMAVGLLSSALLLVRRLPEPARKAEPVRL